MKSFLSGFSADGFNSLSTSGESSDRTVSSPSGSLVSSPDDKWTLKTQEDFRGDRKIPITHILSECIAREHLRHLCARLISH